MTCYFSDIYENQGLEEGVGSVENVHPLPGHPTTGTLVFRCKNHSLTLLILPKFTIRKHSSLSLDAYISSMTPLDILFKLVM